MNHKLKPATRLSIVFIIAVVISGCMLTWFSINNISNLRELTEKKIIEEEKELFYRIQDSIQSKIYGLTAGLSENIASAGDLKDSLLTVIAGREFYIFPFIINHTGNYIFPNFSQIHETDRGVKSNEDYLINFNRGARAEFVDEDYELAGKYLLDCLRHSSGASDSVKALNIIARLFVKSNQTEKAVESYHSIISDYYSEPGPEGLPYAYLALSQLVRIDENSVGHQVLSLFDSILKKIETEMIPLTHFTRDLLAGVEQWIDRNNLEDDKISRQIYDELNNIREQVHFIDSYGIEIKKILNEDDESEEKSTVNGFRITNLFNAGNNSLLLFCNNHEHQFGFVIDSREFLSSIVKTNDQMGLDYEYQVEFPDVSLVNGVPDRLIFQSHLIPYFPRQEARIKLSDENVIAEFIRRRSYIYGIALALLLLGMVLGIILILRDLSREKSLARLQADFTSNVTHELKTPITSIYLFAESMFLDKLKSRTEEKEYLSIIMKESERLKRMINNILEFSRMEKGKQEYHFEKSDLSELLKQAIQEMNYWFQEKNIKLINEIEENVLLEIDREKILQAVTNLLSNAVKFSGDGKSIRIQVFEKSDVIVLAVEDEGIGIPGDQQSRIFEKFYRVEQKETQGISGTGLGLTVVKEIVDAHKGQVIVDSEAGKGSKFSIILNK